MTVDGEITSLTRHQSQQQVTVNFTNDTRHPPVLFDLIFSLSPALSHSILLFFSQLTASRVMQVQETSLGHTL